MGGFLEVEDMTLTLANQRFPFPSLSNRFRGGHVARGWCSQNEGQDFGGNSWKRSSGFPSGSESERL